MDELMNQQEDLYKKIDEGWASVMTMEEGLEELRYAAQSEMDENAQQEAWFAFDTATAAI